MMPRTSTTLTASRRRPRTTPRSSLANDPSHITAASLQTMTFPPLKLIVPGIVPEGATLLVSRPKLGKSWLVLDPRLPLRPHVSRSAS